MLPELLAPPLSPCRCHDLPPEGAPGAPAGHQGTLLAGATEAALALLALGPIKAPLTASVEVKGLRLTILALPSGSSGRTSDLSPCEQDILCVLSEANGRWCTNRVLAELDRRGLIHGECTVKKALSRLHKVGLIGNSRMAPRGYWLAATAEGQR